jgi:transmembrane sensor
MTKLRAPVASELAPQIDERAIQRIWSGVQRRRGGSWFAQRRSSSAWLFGLAGAVLSCALLVAGWHWYGAQANAPSAASAPAAGPLLARSGSGLSVLGGAPASSQELSDGSTIALDAGSRLEVLENTAKTFVSVLRRGRGTFAVRPGGPRRWTIEAGLATVEVVGTRFSVTRAPGSVEVSVEHGVVLVRSDLIQDRVQRLTAGQQLTIHEPLPEPPSAASAASLAGPSAAASAPSTAIHSSAPPSLSELLDQADARRRRGDVRGAETALRAALAAHGSDPQAALAAFTLGKLLLDMAGRPGDAAAAFARCLSLSPPSALAEDALYRLAEAQARAGDSDAAAVTARQYRARYPHGQHERELKRWVGAD